MAGAWLAVVAQVFRESGGRAPVWGAKPHKVTAHYTTGDGGLKTSLLLASGLSLPLTARGGPPPPRFLPRLVHTACIFAGVGVCVGGGGGGGGRFFVALQAPENTDFGAC